MLVAVRDDVPGGARVQPGDVAQELLGSGVELDADAVHATHHDVVERALERVLIDVVLVLADADRLRIELHEFGERVHQAASDRDGAAHGEVVIWELFARDFARRVDRCAAFVHRDDGDGRGESEAADEGLGFASAGAVADRDGLDLEFLHHGFDDLGGFIRTPVTLLGKDNVVAEQFALPVEDDDFAAGAKSGVDREHVLLAERRGEEEFTEVIGEDADGFIIGAFLDGDARLAFHREAEQALETVLRGEPDLLGGRRFVSDKGVLDHSQRLFFGRGEAGEKHAFVLAAADGEDAVGGGGGGGFAPVEVVFKFRAFFFFPADDFGFDDAVGEVERAHFRADCGVVAHALGEDVARSGERLGVVFDRSFHVIDGIFTARVSLRGGEWVGGGILRPQKLGEWLEALFFRNDRARALFRTEGEVDVLERSDRLGRVDAFLQRLGHQLALVQRGDNRVAALVEFAELLEPVADGGDLDFVELARLFFPIPRDKGDGCSFLNEQRSRGNLARLEVEFAGDFEDVIFEHGGGRARDHAERQSRVNFAPERARIFRRQQRAA